MCAHRYLPYFSSLGRAFSSCCRTRVAKNDLDQDAGCFSSGVTVLRLQRNMPLPTVAGTTHGHHYLSQLAIMEEYSFDVLSHTVAVGFPRMPQVGRSGCCPPPIVSPGHPSLVLVC